MEGIKDKQIQSLTIFGTGVRALKLDIVDNREQTKRNRAGSWQNSGKGLAQQELPGTPMGTVAVLSSDERLASVFDAVLSELSDGLLPVTEGLDERFNIPPTIAPPFGCFFFSIPPSDAFLPVVVVLGPAPAAPGLEARLALSGLFSIRTCRSMSILLRGDLIFMMRIGLFSRSTDFMRLGDLVFSSFGLSVPSGDELAEEALSIRSFVTPAGDDFSPVCSEQLSSLLPEPELDDISCWRVTGDGSLESLLRDCGASGWGAFFGEGVGWDGGDVIVAVCCVVVVVVCCVCVAVPVVSVVGGERASGGGEATTAGVTLPILHVLYNVRLYQTVEIEVLEMLIHRIVHCLVGLGRSLLGAAWASRRFKHLYNTLIATGRKSLT
uniref:Uncharacterized protein n=1 Tax=Anopheles culicifacies TaxID=139723 RepID=A0A182M8Q0_9DIPT